jgi:hypothetical protein
MSDKEDTDRVRISQVLAGALAAVTAALIGSTMGVAGTVIGAGLASMVSTIGGALYLRSIERTTKGVRTVRAKVVGKSGGTTVLVAEEDPEKEPGDEVEADPAVASDEQPPEERRRLRWPMLVVASLAAFALGMLAVTGVEWVRGESLSGDGGTTFGSIVDRQRDGGTQQEQPVAPTTSSTTTTTDAPDKSTSSSTDSTSTTTTPPSSDPSTATTTTEPPATTTTEAQPPSASVTPTN